MFFFTLCIYLELNPIFDKYTFISEFLLCFYRLSAAAFESQEVLDELKHSKIKM